MMRKLLLSIISIAIGLMTLATTAQEPSPAGGGWIEFDGTQESSLVVANKDFLQNIEVITIEAWVYLRSKPKDGEEWIIASKHGSFALKLNTGDIPGIGKGVYLGFTIFFSENKGYITALPFNYFNKWIHIAGAFDSQSNFMGVYLNGFISGGGERLQEVPERLPKSEANFEIGLGLNGLIDEMRISKVRRYPTSGEFQPPFEGFKMDKDTVALWHFNEPEGETVFKDSSDNNNTLVRKMDISMERVEGDFPVQPTDTIGYDERNVRIGYKFTPGDLRAYSVTMNVTTPVAHLDNMVAKAIQDAIFSLNVKSVDETEAAEIELTVEDVTMHIKLAEQTMPTSAEVLQALKQFKFRSKIGSDGKVLSLSELKGVIEAGQTQQMLEWALLWTNSMFLQSAVFPDKEVEVGSSWSEEYELAVPVSEDSKLKRNFQYTLLGFEEYDDYYCAKLLTEGSFESLVSADVLMKQTGEVKGIIYFALNEGVMVRMETAFDMSISMNMPGKEQPVDLEIKGVQKAIHREQVK